MKKIALEDMILTKDLPTTAGSRMLSGYISPFDATVVQKLRDGGFEIVGKVPVGEFGIDLVGESCYLEEAAYATANILKTDTVTGVISCDVNGAPRRVAAQKGLCYLKPTFDRISRCGTVAAVSSADTLGISARCAKDVREIFSALCKAQTHRAPLGRVAVLGTAVKGEVAALLESAKRKMAANGIEFCEIDVNLPAAHACWNTLLCAELCANLSRYDGIRYGYRAMGAKDWESLCTKSRSEGFGTLVKSAILYGSDALYGKNYAQKYDKALRVRRVIAEELARAFETVDAILLPACSKLKYDENDHPFEENAYTALASLAGVPAVVAGGVQMIGPAFSEDTLLTFADFLMQGGGEK